MFMSDHTVIFQLAAEGESGMMAIAPIGRDDVPGTRTDRRRARTRSALIAAGQRLFATRALESVSIDDIAAAADIAKGSFYNYFDDKEGLARAIIERVQADCEHHIGLANDGIADPAHRMARAMAVVVIYAHDHPDRVQAMLALSERRRDIEAPLNEGVTRDIRQGLEGGQFCGVSIQSGVLVAQGLISVAVDFLQAQTAKGAAAAVVREMGAALLRALGVDPAKAPEIAAEAAGLIPDWGK
jgi:AcrR family transcriptional regulator